LRRRKRRIDEAGVADHAAPQLARARGADDAGGGRDAQEGDLEEVVGDVVDGCCRPASVLRLDCRGHGGIGWDVHVVCPWDGNKGRCRRAVVSFIRHDDFFLEYQ
jgi:hypothetical protein